MQTLLFQHDERNALGLQGTFDPFAEDQEVHLGHPTGAGFLRASIKPTTGGD
jgi:hypothetical protein